MTIDLKELIKRPEYKWLEEYKDRLCFITLGGSFAYGTNVEGSDIDLRGVMLPTKEELIGLKSFEQRIDENTDSCIYDFNKFVHLVMNCNPNCIELLGCREYLIFNKVGEELIDKAKLFLSKKCVNSFGGYATAQLRRLENALCHDSYPEEEKVKHMKATMDVAMQKLEDKNEIYANQSIKTFAEGDKLLLDVDIKHQEIEKVRAALNDILTIEKTYNKLNQRNKKKTEEKLDKHCMHLIRLYLTVFDILEKGKIETFRANDRQFLLDIRNGKFIKDGKLTEEFSTYLRELEARLQEDVKTTKLPDKPDYKEIEKFVIDVNTRVINNNIEKYIEPLNEVIVY